MLSSHAVQAHLALVVLALFCAGAVVCDVRIHRVPNFYNAAFFACGVCLALAREGARGLAFSLAGSALGLALLVVPFLLRMVGGGDVKFLAAAGAIVGWRAVWPAFLLGALAGGLLALIALIYRTRSPAAVGRTLLLLEHGAWRLPGPIVQERHVNIPYTLPLSAGLLVVAAVHLFTRGVS